MPRLALLDALGVLHHVIIRGIERNKIFRDKADYDNFIDRLSRLIPGRLRGTLVYKVTESLK